MDANISETPLCDQVDCPLLRKEDLEAAAIASMGEILSQLDLPARSRVLKYCMERHVNMLRREQGI